MAGRPLRRAVLGELTRRAVALFDEDNASPTEYVIAWVEEGKTLTSLAEELTGIAGSRVWTTSIRRFLDAHEPGAGARIDAAKPKGAHMLLEDALDIVDTAGETPTAVAKAKLRADTRMAIAAKWNRAELGNDRGSSVTVNIGALHLDALRSARASFAAPTLRAISGSVAECETVSEGHIAECESEPRESKQVVTEMVTPDYEIESSDSDLTT